MHKNFLKNPTKWRYVTSVSLFVKIFNISQRVAITIVLKCLKSIEKYKIVLKSIEKILNVLKSLEKYTKVLKSIFF